LLSLLKPLVCSNVLSVMWRYLHSVFIVITGLMLPLSLFLLVASFYGRNEPAWRSMPGSPEYHYSIAAHKFEFLFIMLYAVINILAFLCLLRIEFKKESFSSFFLFLTSALVIVFLGSTLAGFFPGFLRP
jgi:hypothetical protein